MALELGLVAHNGLPLPDPVGPEDLRPVIGVVGRPDDGGNIIFIIILSFCRNKEGRGHKHHGQGYQVDFSVFHMDCSFLLQNKIILKNISTIARMHFLPW
jgi:hypothetical protein